MGIDGPLILAYSREQAILDGILIDVSDIAKEAGFCLSVAITHTLFHERIVPTEDLLSYGESEDGRLWDLLFVLHFIGRKTKGNHILFKVFFTMDAGKEPEEVDIKAVIGPGDTGEPVLTIMYPHED